MISQRQKQAVEADEKKKMDEYDPGIEKLKNRVQPFICLSEQMDGIS